MKALISIHDVMPETLQRVRSILAELPETCHKHLLMLVVPGRRWSPIDIEQLHYWQAQGYILAGHGWLHEAEHIHSIYHRAHARLISRNAAEHLALDRAELVDLLHRNHAWFRDQDLCSPDYYVPPAWAMGALSTEDLIQAPFRFYENIGGIYDSATRQFHTLPLAGFEADSAWRRSSLGVWNQLNVWMAGPTRPLRIAIHPDDPQLRLAQQLNKLTAKVSQAVNYRTHFRLDAKAPNRSPVSV